LKKQRETVGDERDEIIISCVRRRRGGPLSFTRASLSRGEREFRKEKPENGNRLFQTFNIIIGTKAALDIGGDRFVVGRYYSFGHFVRRVPTHFSRFSNRTAIIFNE